MRRCVIIILTGLLLVVGIVAFVISLREQKYQYRISSIQSQISSLQEATKKKSGLEAQPLSRVLGISEDLTQNILKSFHLNSLSPIIGIVINRIDCGACYNFHSERIHAIVEQYHIPVMAITYHYVDYVQRDFRSTLLLFPPPLAQQFLESCSDNILIFCLMPNGFIMYADIPNPENHQSSNEFYRRAIAAIKVYQ